MSLKIGQSCNPGTSSYNATSFVLTPWPATPGTIVSFNMTGTFVSAQNVTQLKIAQFNGSQWKYVDWDIHTSYSAGQQVSF